MSAFRSLLSDNAPAVDFADILEVLSLPASLVAGMSELILHASDDPPLSGVAEAQEEWSRHWQWAQRKSKHVHIAEPIRKRCLTLLGEYTTARDLLMLHNLRLDPAEQQVVISRWGLHKGPALSRAEIADKMAVSREWVRQLERSALDKLGQNAAVRSAYKNHEEVSSQ